MKTELKRSTMLTLAEHYHFKTQKAACSAMPIKSFVLAILISTVERSEKNQTELLCPFKRFTDIHPVKQTLPFPQMNSQKRQIRAFCWEGTDQWNMCVNGQLVFLLRGNRFACEGVSGRLLPVKSFLKWLTVRGTKLPSFWMFDSKIPIRLLNL